MTEALGETFQATWWVLGDELFFECCRHYIQRHHSHYYNLSDYGETFPTFLKRRQKLRSIPYLEELASFEWSFKNIFHAPSRSCPPKDFTDLEKASDFTISFCQAFAQRQHNYPVFNLWKHSKVTDLTSQKTNRIDLSKDEWLVMYKVDNRVMVKELDPYQWQLLNLLAQGHSFQKSLEQCEDDELILNENHITELFQFLRQNNLIKEIMPL